MSRDPQAPEYAGGTLKTNVANALDFMTKTVPGFAEHVRGASVLDFGCGLGHQAAAVAQRGAGRVVGFDVPRDYLLSGWQRIRALGLPNLSLTTTLPDEPFDVVFSCSSFEHFADPEAMLGIMKGRVRPGGKLIISFAEPWLSPRGSHMDGFTRVPWVNILFDEATVLRVRGRYYSDGATRYEDIVGGLNRMTVSRFETIIRRSGMNVDGLWLTPVKGLPLVTRVPLLRELLTSAASCVLSPCDASSARAAEAADS
jgi:ubiquinone/menaquinone biosynthesis C-methylase UbiE